VSFAEKWKFKSEAAACGFIHRLINLLYEPLVSRYVYFIPRADQIANGWILPNSSFPEAIAIIDTKFQQTNRPKGRFSESVYYFSKKHGAYGIKTEITHARNGRAMAFSKHYVGSVHDYNVLSEWIDNLRQILTKTNADKLLRDTGELCNDYRNTWACLFDKAYCGAETRVQAIVPMKNVEPGSAADRRNTTIGNERVMAENFYGRMTQLWGIIAKKYRWDHRLYDKVIGIAIALTNAHIDITPLRDDEHEFYQSLLGEYAAVAHEQLEREKLSKEKSRRRVRERVQRLRIV